MSYDAEVATTLDGAMTDLRDKVGGMTGWSIAYDNFTSWKSGKFVLEMPSGEYLEFTDENSFDDPIEVRYGVDYDTSGGSWNDAYSNSFNFAPQTDNSALNGGNSVTYWLSYAQNYGFLFYIERNEGDGDDGDAAFGVAEINKTWAYGTATNREGDYAILARGGDGSSGEWNGVGEGNGRTSSDTVTAKGLVNPDANFTDFVMMDRNYVASSQYKNGIGSDAFIGYHEFWLNDRSGNSSAHKETVDDGASNDKWVLLDNHGNTGGIAMRVDL